MNGRGAPTLRALFPAIREAMEMTGSFVLTATGSSMEPFLKGGRDRVTLVPPGARPIRRGDVVLFQRDCGAFVLHRVRGVDGNGDMRIVGDAQLVCEFVRRDQLRAVVKSCVRKGRRIDCERGLVRALLTARMRARTRFPRAARTLTRALRLARRMAALCLRGAGRTGRQGTSSAHS